MSNQHFIGIAQMKISNDPSDLLIAPNLGSCLGVAVYDPVHRVGGMIHCLLPLSKSDPAKAAANPCMYVDTGVPLLLQQLLAFGVDKRELVIIAAGCANINDEQNIFEIGKKNHTVFRKVLWKNNLLTKAEMVGESVSRTMTLHVESGRVTVKVSGELVELWGGHNGVQCADYR